MQAQVKSGKLTQREFLAWRRREMAQSQWAKSLYAEIEYDLKHASEIASTIINETTADAYIEGYTAGLYDIEKGIKAEVVFGTTEGRMFSRHSVKRLLVSNPSLLPIAGTSRWGTKRLRTAVAQSIMRGESINKLAQRLNLITGMESKSAIRNARTIMTSAQNGGRQQVAEDAEAIGINLTKVWVATLDDRTRDSHAEMDGVEVPVDEPFDVNGSELMYPADPNGDPAEVYNCRCTLVYNVDGSLESVDPNVVERVSKVPDYDEWKRHYQG